MRLNGTVHRDPESPVALEADRIEIDGGPLKATEKIYLVLNKPRGVVTTASDEKGRRTVYDLLDKNLPWMAPVGRLDQASEGLLLLTNDPEWAAPITSPETHLDKTYHVQIAAKADERLLLAMHTGVKSEGEVLRVKTAAVLREGKRNTWLEVVLDEGRNRQIRRLLSALGVEVLRLVRVSIGTLEMGELKKGSSRFLTTREKQDLDRAMRQTRSVATARGRA